jgi:hypothetical protein
MTCRGKRPYPLDAPGQVSYGFSILGSDFKQQKKIMGHARPDCCCMLKIIAQTHLIHGRGWLNSTIAYSAIYQRGASWAQSVEGTHMLHLHTDLCYELS